MSDREDERLEAERIERIAREPNPILDTLTFVDPAAPPAPVAIPTPPRSSWWHTRFIAPLKRSHWFFRLGDVVRYRLELQDGLRRDVEGLARGLLVVKRENYQLASLLKDARDRLAHHEAGPLQASRAELDRRRKDGMVRPIEAKRNGAKPKPSKSFDASGKLKELPDEPSA